MLTLVSLLVTMLLRMATSTKLRGDIFAQFWRCRCMVLMTFEAVTILHCSGMSFVAIQAIQSFAMTWMTFTTFHFCMCTWIPFHVLSGFLMTAKTNAAQICDCTKIDISGRVRIMTLQTLAGGKMFVVSGIMTISTGWQNTFFIGRMFCMAVYTGQILKMCAAII